MTAEQWEQIKQLFEAALEQPSASRAAFLAQACADDAELRRSVEAMLSADAQEDLLLDRPAHQAAAALLVTSEMQMLPEQMIGSYRLLRQIGRGGMGAVYLAHDTRLGRQVALKLLPDYLTGDAERVRRFQREARAASGLNHPNILTIYDFGQDAGQHYIATEFVEGKRCAA